VILLAHEFFEIMLNRKTYIGVAIIIIISLLLIGLVWWWYGKKLALLDNKIPQQTGVENNQYRIIAQSKSNETYV